MVVVQHLLRRPDVVLHLGRLVPGNAQHPVEVVAHHRRLGGHRAHGAQLLDLGQRLLARLLGELGLADALLHLGQLVAAVLVAVAQLLLDRLQLLVQIVLALGLLHLALDAAADALLHLQHADLAFHEGEDALEAMDDALGLQQLLLLGDLQAEMGGDRVGELALVLDLVDRDQHLRRDLLVELDVLLELGDHRAGERLDFLALVVAVGDAARHRPGRTRRSRRSWRCGRAGRLRSAPSPCRPAASGAAARCRCVPTV